MSYQIHKNQIAEKVRQPQAKWSLTARAFNCLLSRLDVEGAAGEKDFDSERAGEKYLLLRRNLVRFFEGRAVAEAEEAADEACNRLARKLEAGERIENINQYAYGVARMLALEIRKAQRRERQVFEQMPPAETLLPAEAASRETAEIRLTCLDKNLDRLPADSRRLILSYYQSEGREKIETRRRLAENLGIPNNALRNRAVRLRQQLKILIAKDLIEQTI